MLKLGAKELRTTNSSDDQKKLLKKNPIYIICDNILDTYNVGSIFRLADAVAATKVYLTGVTETPPNTRIKKASINTTEWVEWEYFASTADAIADVRKKFSDHSVIPAEAGIQENGSPIPQGTMLPEHYVHRTVASKRGAQSGMTSGIQVVAVEQSPRSVPFDKAEYTFPICLIVSNETSGATQEVLEAVDLIVEMPMWGVNKSLNVMVSLGIVLYQVVQKLPVIT